MHKFYHIHVALSKICKDKDRHSPTSLQRYLCMVIFPCWRDFCGFYGEHLQHKYHNIESFLSALFEIDIIKINSILHQLDIYKDYKLSEIGIMTDCLNVKLCL